MEQVCDAVRRQAAEFEMLLAQCRGRQVWLQTHNFPDPDAIASAFGLQRLLADLGVTAQICCVGQIDKLSTAKLVDTFGIRLYGSTGISGIPFACPDALIAILSDFLLSLAEVQLTVVYSRRSDGIKFSVRSEDPKLHAGELVRRALEGVGSGGGHSFMAGGLIPAERIGALGSAPEDAIVERFLHALQNG